MDFSFGDFPIKNKIVLVTGGGSGIGLAFVKRAHSQGAKVLIADLKLHAAASKLGITEETERIVFQKTDVAKWNDLQSLIPLSMEKFGDVPDIYVATAGIFEPKWSNFWDDAEDERYNLMDVNTNHPIKLTRIAIRALLGKKKKGVVLIVASILGYSSQYTAPLYTASKHALVGFTKSMNETGKNQDTKVVAICPGLVATPLWLDNPEVQDRYAVVDDLMISPDTVAQSMFHLIEDGQNESGTVLEISMLGERVVPAWNIDPPGMVQGKMAKGTEFPKEAAEKANMPVLKVTDSERGVLL